LHGQSFCGEILSTYLAFSVIRPLPAAPIGRTVLRTYRGVQERCFALASIKHRVHLAGLTIELEGCLSAAGPRRRGVRGHRSLRDVVAGS
jgi:hypothetical protein